MTRFLLAKNSDIWRSEIESPKAVRQDIFSFIFLDLSQDRIRSAPSCLVEEMGLTSIAMDDDEGRTWMPG